MEARTIGAVIVSSVLSSALSALGVGIAFSAGDCAEEPAVQSPPSASVPQVPEQVASAQSAPADLVVRSLRIVDADGKTCIEAGIGERGTYLWINDADAGSRAGISCSQDAGAYLWLKSGTTAGSNVSLNARSDESSEILVGNSRYEGVSINSSKNAAGISLDHSLSSTIVCTNQGEKSLSTLSLSAQGGEFAGTRLEMQSFDRESDAASAMSTLNLNTHKLGSYLSLSNLTTDETKNAGGQSHVDIISSPNRAGLNSRTFGTGENSGSESANASLLVSSSFDLESSDYRSRASLNLNNTDEAGAHNGASLDVLGWPSLSMYGEELELLWIEPEYSKDHTFPVPAPGVPVEPGSVGAQWGALTTEDVAKQEAAGDAEDEAEREDAD